MTAAELIDQLDDLGLSLADLSDLTGEDGDRCARWVKGTEAIPVWLDLLTSYWSQVPETLEIARTSASAGVARRQRARARRVTTSQVL